MVKILFFLFVLIISFKTFPQIVPKEKIASMQKDFNPTTLGGPTWDEFGDLVFEKNGKTYWMSTFCSIVDVADDYYRIFEIDFSSGTLIEVTKEMIGEFIPTGGFNPPYYYEDIDNDGIKDILIFDHGKELASELGHWGGKNMFFKGTAIGFKKTEIPNITTEKKYYHAHAVGDFDFDGDLDLAYGTEYANIFVNDGKGNFTKQTINNLGDWGYFINNNYFASGSFGLKFVNIDNDKELELISPIETQPIYLDYSNNTWTAKFFGPAKSFIWKDNIHIGVEQILETPNIKSKKNDLLFRIATYDYPIEGGKEMKWMSKLYQSKSNKIDSVFLFKNNFTQSNSFFFLDPKLVDLNFDGNPDVFFKEDEFWGNTGQKLHSINQRIWYNDGESNFSPGNLKFSDEVNQLIYILAKVDTVKRINIMFSQRALNLDGNNKPTQNQRYLYNRIDTLVYPIQARSNLKICNGNNDKITVANVPVSVKILENSKSSNVANVGTSYIQLKGNEAGMGTISYKLYNSFFEGETYNLNYTIIDKPATPSITREGNYLISSSGSNNQWYVDGVKIPNENGMKINATLNGLYTVQTKNSDGCLSDFSKGEYGLITAIEKEEYKLPYPNPVNNLLKVHFPNDLGNDVEMIITNMDGQIMIKKSNIQNGYLIDCSKLASGNYVLNTQSNENDKTFTFKFSKE